MSDVTPPTPAAGRQADDPQVLDDRKAAILRAVVEEYIETAQPVGSGHVACSARGQRVVGHGAQRHGHARAGGLPRPAPHQRRPGAHREGLPVLRRHARRARPRSAPATPSRSGLLRRGPRRARADAARHQPAAVEPHRLRRGRGRARRTRPPPSARCSSSGSRHRVALLVVVLSNGVVEKHTLELDRRRRRRACSAPPPRTLAGRTLGGRAAAAGARRPPPTRRRRGRRHRAPRPSTPLRGADEPTTPSTSSSAARRGWRRRSTPSRPCARCCGILEQQYVVVTLLRDVLDRGPARGHRHRDRHGAAGRLLGRRGALRGRGRAGRHASACSGPTRMNYPQALAAVAVVSQRLGRRLSEG